MAGVGPLENVTAEGSQDVEAILGAPYWHKLPGLGLPDPLLDVPTFVPAVVQRTTVRARTGSSPPPALIISKDELNSLPEPLDISWIPKVPVHTTGSPQQNDFNQEEDVSDPQLLNQERNVILVQVKPVCCQIKEEQEELRISQEGEQFGLKQETETFNEDLPQKHECKQEEVLDDQQLWNQERNNGLDHEEPKPLQVKEEHEGSINQGEVLLVQKQEADTFMLTSIYEQNDHREAETSKFETTINFQYRLPDVSREPVIKLNRIDVPQQHDFSKEEVHIVQERHSILDQEEPNLTGITGEEEKPLRLKQETDTFMVTPTNRDSNRETEPISEQLLSHNSPDTESKDQASDPDSEDDPLPCEEDSESDYEPYEHDVLSAESETDSAVQTKTHGTLSALGTVPHGRGATSEGSAALPNRGRGVKRQRTSQTVSGRGRDLERNSPKHAAGPRHTPCGGRGHRGTVRHDDGRSAGYNGTVSTNNDGWDLLRDEEDYQVWLKPFEEAVGYRGDVDLSSAQPIDFLSLFWTEEFWRILTEETNRYAEQFLAQAKDDLKPKSRFHKWTAVTEAEMKAFMALHLCMGIVAKPTLVDYWSEFWPTLTPGFGRVMSRCRFTVILSCLHFVNNENSVAWGEPGHDRLFKIRPIIDCIVPRFAAVYAPGKELSLDEMMIPFKGRSTLKLYNPQKTDKYGYKAVVLSEASTGYVLEWSLDTGQNGDECDSLGLTHLVVRQLMEPHTGKGHEVYMDSCYTSPAIAKELAAKDTGVCGTVNCNRRGMPKDLRPAQLPLRRGDDPVFMRQDKLLACAWHDTKRFSMLSSIHGNTCVLKRIRTKGSVTGFRHCNKPACVDSYKRYMGGVDRADQRMKTYLFPHRARKWYSCIFNALMSVCVVNSHIIYTRSTPGPHKPLKVFIQEQATSLLEGYKRMEGERAGRPSQQALEMPQRLIERHFLAEAHGRLDCAVCSDRSRHQGRRQTHFRCAQCESMGDGTLRGIKQQLS
ncbi:uncharacterized protein KZ484_021087 [Pholidichthys leucotaenia]